MRLAELMHELSDEDLERLEEASNADHEASRSAIIASLETSLRSYSFVKGFVGDCMPPTFSILELLLNAEGFALPAAGFREHVDGHTTALIERVANGDLVGRDNSIRLYRRVLFEARRNDLVLDTSETAILGVLRAELAIRQHEHFLIEHHPDFHHLWKKPHSFFDQMSALRSRGLVFAHEGRLVLAADVVPVIRRVLGFELSPQAYRRLLDHFTGKQLGDALAEAGIKTSGARDEKQDRLLASYVQPSEALRALSLAELRDLCRDTNAAIAGAKEEVVDRLVDHFLQGGDLPQQKISAPPPPPEARTLDEQQFRGLFSSLRGEELTEILMGIDSSRITGSKDVKVNLLVESRFSETTLLDKLTSKNLEETLDKLRLKTSGAKRERVERIVDVFRRATATSSQDEAQDA